MEYIYAAMLLHEAGQKVDEKGVGKILDAAGVKKDDARVKALVAAMDGVDIEEAISKAAVAAPAAAAAPAAGAPAEAEKKEEKKDEEQEEKKDEAAAAGLGALFG